VDHCVHAWNSDPDCRFGTLGVVAHLRKRKIKRRWVVLLWMIGPILLLLAPASLNILFNSKAYSAKEGRVIDTATGNGMPNVAVIAVANFFGANLVHGSTQATLYRVITHTDADGNYRIPSKWGELVWWFPSIPGTAPDIRWIITVFQPGYAVIGDDRALEYYEHGEGAMDPNSVWLSPPATWLGTTTRVEPIKVHSVQISLKQTARYAQRIMGAGESVESRNSPEELALRKLGNQVFLPQVCALDPEATMDPTEAGALTAFGYDFVQSNGRLGELEPSGRQDAYPHPIFHTRNVCEAMKAGG
jgi:hypothetical protein